MVGVLCIYIFHPSLSISSISTIMLRNNWLQVLKMFDVFSCTTSQVKRQHYVYATYHLIDNNIFFGYVVCWEMHRGGFVTAYYRFVNQSHLVPENIISLSMDGPSVNKLFKEKFESDLEKKGHFIIDVRSCSNWIFVQAHFLKCSPTLWVLILRYDVRTWMI